MEPKETIRDLKEREKLLRCIMDALPVTISYVGSDQCYRFNNKTYEDWFGCRLEDIRGRHLAEVLSEDHYAGILRHVNAVLTGRTVSHERVVTFKDGTDHHLKASYVPNFGPKDEVKGFFSLSVDVSEIRSAQEALRKSEAEKSVILDNLSEMVSFRDLEHRFVWVNKAKAKYYGVTQNGLVGETCHRYFYGLDRPCEGCPAVKARETGVPQQVEKDSFNSRRLIVRSIPLFDREGLPMGMMDVATDVTDRRDAEKLLAYKANLLAVVNEAVVACDTLSLVTEWNHAAERMFGWKASEVLGRSFDEVLRCEFVGVDRDEVLRSLKDTGQLRSEMVFFRRDGSTVNVETTATTMKDDSGETIGYVSVHRDISERKRVQEALHSSHQQLLDIIEFLPDATLVVDGEGRVIAWNRAIEEMTGVSKKEILGRGGHVYGIPFYGEPGPLLIDVVIDDRIDIDEHYEFVEKKGNTVFGEVYAPKAYGGKGAYLWGTASPLFDARGNRIGAIQSIRDITDRKKARDSVLQSERQLRHLSARLLKAQEEERKRIARELHDSTGQSLAALKFYAENALSSGQKGDTTETYKSFERLIPMIQNAIEEARRIYMGLRPSILDDLGITATIRWYCREVRKTCPGIAIDEKIDISEEEIPNSLKIVIFRIIQEAINNIMKYSEAENVRISLVRSASSIELTVEDDGSGFDLDSYLQKGNQERGLGLAGMKERMELTGGNFIIRSSKGQGTTVCGIWPADAAELDDFTAWG